MVIKHRHCVMFWRTCDKSLFVFFFSLLGTLDNKKKVYEVMAIFIEGQEDKAVPYTLIKLLKKHFGCKWL